MKTMRHITLSFLLSTLLLTASSACTGSRTQIMVVADTDLTVPGQIDTIEFEVTGPEGQMAAATANPATSLPAFLGVEHTGGPLGPITVRVVGRRGGAVVVERAARVDFQPDRTVVLEMHLHASCISRTCSADQTCAAGGCRPLTVSAGELSDWTGTPPTIDGGTPPRDGGTDTGTDTGVDACVASPELCNGIDDDCDGVIDEEVITLEICNGIDDDCDMMVDEGLDAPETCNGMDDDCDMMIDEDFDLTTDLMNCGTCGTVCTVMDGTPVCTAGMCEIMACDGTFMSCDMDVATGCETETQTSDLHCGGCDMPCSMVETCTTGACACDAPYETITTGCADITRDPQNCGAVGTVCADVEYCIASACACRPGLTSDGVGGCVNTLTDPAHCGGIDAACDPGDACRSGSCRPNCTGGLTDCSGACTVLARDDLNCGACGTVCTTGEVCADSACRPFEPGLGCTSCPCTTCPGATNCCPYPMSTDVVCVDGPCPI